MSTFLDNAELIKTRLLTAPAGDEAATTLDLTGLEIFVFRQGEIASQVAKAVAGASGCAVEIYWQGFRNADVNSRKPRLGNSYKVVVTTKPVIAGENLRADDVMESIIQRLWHWRPLGPGVWGEIEIEDGGLVPDKRLLKYDLDVTLTATH